LKSESAEALIRWNHPEFGLVSPDEFIPLSEQSGLIVDLTHWILRTVCKQLADWHKQNIHMNVSINISPISLLNPEFPDIITGLLANYKLPGELVTLEITESTLVRDPNLALGVLNQLAALGIKISIDDFGTGYSSLAYLKKMPATELKIDQEFVRDMLENDSDYVIVRTTIDLAHNLGMKVVAEGVETQEVSSELNKLGCEVLQGYLFSKPLPIKAYEQWLDKNSH